LRITATRDYEEGRTHLLHVDQTCRLWGCFLGHIWRHPHDELSDEFEVEEHRHKGGGVVHRLDERVVEVRFVDCVAGLSKAEIGDDIHRHALEGEKEVRRFAGVVLASKGGA
jgi:hypothetical protein